MSPWSVAEAALTALGPAALKLLSGDEKAAVIAAKKAVAKQAIKAVADQKRKALGK